VWVLAGFLRYGRLSVGTLTVSEISSYRFRDLSVLSEISAFIRTDSHGMDDFGWLFEITAFIQRDRYTDSRSQRSFGLTFGQRDFSAFIRTLSVHPDGQRSYGRTTDEVKNIYTQTEQTDKRTRRTD